MTDILKFALLAKDLALDTDTKFRDARSAGPIPEDFGDHEPIPDEAITVEVVDTKGRKLKAASTPLEMVKISDLEHKFEIDLGAMDQDAAAAFLEKVRAAYEEYRREK